MSLKAIDTQLSLSRIKDVGTIQNQLNHKAADDQAALAATARREMEEDRKKLSKANSKGVETKIKDQQKQHQQGQTNSHQKNHHPNQEEQPNSSDHPYKGRRIDISL